MAAARIVMQSWARSYQAILLKSGLRLTDLSGYVDDGRHMGTTLRRGMRYDKTRKMFIQDEDSRKVDDEMNEPNNVRMARVCRDAMNDISTDLEFTTESPEEFAQGRLPTLDFKLWLVNGIMYWSYFEKEMRTPLSS